MTKYISKNYLYLMNSFVYSMGFITYALISMDLKHFASGFWIDTQGTSFHLYV